MPETAAVLKCKFPAGSIGKQTFTSNSPEWSVLPFGRGWSKYRLGCFLRVQRCRRHDADPQRRALIPSPLWCDPPGVAARSHTRTLRRHVTSGMSSDDDPLRRSVRAAFNGLRNLSVHTAAVGRAILAEPTSNHPLASSDDATGFDSDAEATPPEAGRKRLGDGLRAWQQKATTAGSGGSASDRSGGITSTSGRGPDHDWLYVGADTVQQRRTGHALFEARLQQFKRELEQKGSVDMRNVRALAYDGVPDGEGLRPVIWKVRRADQG